MSCWVRSNLLPNKTFRMNIKEHLNRILTELHFPGNGTNALTSKYYFLLYMSVCLHRSIHYNLSKFISWRKLITL